VIKYIEVNLPIAIGIVVVLWFRTIQLSIKKFIKNVNLILIKMEFIISKMTNIVESCGMVG
jgi:hypothetical protein